MSRRVVRWLTIAATAVGLTAIAACNTPHIPVPPPGSPSFQSMLVDDGMGGKRKVWEPRGAARSIAANGRYYVFNRDTGSGIIATAMPDGSYVGSPLDGKEGDAIEVFYRTSVGEASSTSCTTLAEGQPPPVLCP